MRIPPNGKQGKPGTNQRAQALTDETTRDARNRLCVAQHIASDAAYVNAPCLPCGTASELFTRGMLSMCDVCRTDTRIS